MLSIIRWGIPNENHPFNYHMDEWHQLQAVRGIFTQGSPNIPGAAHGTIFHFFLSGIYVAPFALSHIVDPFSIKSSVDDLLMQEKLFVILRLNTLLFGVLSIVVLRKILKNYLQIKNVYPIIFFVFNPMWLALSNFFKYDIALIFWILLALLFLLRFSYKLRLKNYLLAGFFCALSVAVKISAIGLLPIFVFAFFFFTPKKRNYAHLLYGLLVFFITFILIGVPDLLLQKGDVREFLYSNIVGTPNETSNFILPNKNWWEYFISVIIPSDFGYVFSGIFILSFFWILTILKRYKNWKRISFIIICFLIFLLSILPLKLYAAGNRLLVLLPFFAIFAGFSIERILNISGARQKYVHVVIIIFVFLQLTQSLPSVFLKWHPDVRQVSSQWLKENIPKGARIGVENIPIYQGLPDLVVKEFYISTIRNNFKYEIISVDSPTLPDIVIITNGDLHQKYLKNSDKKALIKRLKEEDFRKSIEFKAPLILYASMKNELVFYTSGIVATPTIAIYAKE